MRLLARRTGSGRVPVRCCRVTGRSLSDEIFVGDQVDAPCVSKTIDEVTTRGRGEVDNVDEASGDAVTEGESEDETGEVEDGVSTEPDVLICDSELDCSSDGCCLG